MVFFHKNSGKPGKTIKDMVVSCTVFVVLGMKMKFLNNVTININSEDAVEVIFLLYHSL